MDQTQHSESEQTEGQFWEELAKLQARHYWPGRRRPTMLDTLTLANDHFSTIIECDDGLVSTSYDNHFATLRYDSDMPECWLLIQILHEIAHVALRHHHEKTWSHGLTTPPRLTGKAAEEEANLAALWLYVPDSHIKSIESPVAFKRSVSIWDTFFLPYGEPRLLSCAPAINRRLSLSQSREQWLQ